MKDPEAVLDYTLDWSGWLPPGDRIVSLSATVTPADALAITTTEYTDSLSTVWLSGGVGGVTYSVVHHITTDAGREDDRTMLIAVKEK